MGAERRSRGSGMQRNNERFGNLKSWHDDVSLTSVPSAGATFALVHNNDDDGASIPCVHLAFIATNLVILLLVYQWY